jgi:hypothetical protein
MRDRKRCFLARERELDSKLPQVDARGIFRRFSLVVTAFSRLMVAPGFL